MVFADKQINKQNFAHNPLGDVGVKEGKWIRMNGENGKRNREKEREGRREAEEGENNSNLDGGMHESLCR